MDNRKLWHIYPQARGDLTKEKIKKYLKDVGRSRKSHFGHRQIAQYDDSLHMGENLFWHGTTNCIEGGLKPSITFSQRDLQARANGGWGDAYFGVSLSASKEVASNFTGNKTHGRIYPVLLNPEAKVISRPDLRDACEIEDEIEILWKDRVDAVRLGDWNRELSEKELLVINPKAIMLIDQPTSFLVFQKPKFENPSGELLEAMYNTALEELDDFNLYARTSKKDPLSQELKQSLSAVFSEKFEIEFEERNYSRMSI